MRRFIGIVMMYCLALACVWASGQAQGADTVSASGDTVNPPGELPIVDKKASLTVFAPSPSFDIKTNEHTLWLEEQTNVHIEWQLFPGSGLEEKMNILLAGGDYPDVFMSTSTSPSAQMVYGSMGVFRPLNDLIDRYGFNSKKAAAKYANFLPTMTAPDGNIYGLPEINDCYHCRYYRGRYWINETWLDNLGLSMPNTHDELFDVLTAFKEQDPNGNGRPDEIPLAFAGGESFYNNDTGIDIYLIGPFIYDDAKNRLIRRNGKVDVVYDKPEWREGIRFMHKMYKAGLIYEESFVMKRKQLQQIGENEGDNILGSAPAGHPGRFTQYNGPSGRFREYVAVPPLLGPDGTRTSFYDPEVYLVNGQAQYIVTSGCENPAVALRWADYLFDQEVTLRNVQGRPGIEWRYAESGEVGINGKPAVYTALVDTYAATQNFMWAQFGLTFRPSELRLGRTAEQDPKAIEILLYNETSRKYAPYKPETDILVPALWFDEGTSAEIADLRATIEDYMIESLYQFIIGNKDIEKDWDAYTAELNNMGLQRYVELLRKAYSEKYE